MPSPPKPWEVNNANTTAVVTSPSAAATISTSAPDIPARTTTNTTTIDLAPARPTSYTNTGYGSMGNYSSMGYNSTYGNAGYGLGSSYNRYGSGYGSYGGYGGGYGSYGGGYGSYGGGYGGMNRFGRMGGPDEMGLTQRMEMGTRPAFEVVENIVGSFGGFAQMLESTFMATHSSFMAMVGVAEQLGFLKNYLGQVFSVFALYRFVKRAVQKITGRIPSAKPMEMNLMEFENFDKAPHGPKMSRKPLIIFMLMVVGLPYMMHKLIQLISANQQKQMALPVNQQAPIDPSKLEFARAMYDFNAESSMELSLKKGDIVAVISKSDPNTNTVSQWWRGRLRDGTMGMFPANHVEIIQKGGPQHAAQEAKEVLKEEALITAPNSPQEKLV
ncbi:Peroxin 13, N-terminal region-domain-containing protein [Gilbertella persicaria]|uniref:Peroxin 13, N-terminal region-domain-containing protein n=1 Tax=Gilbertella persicaria TaxID=101096 RepID=UPI0022209158|nr:Peroxin 13, N-terminal region-domain-containing protein [Gilbertella persicaria]KAI8049795.1 Peroxin 13, N-terminal region-domain-containing protein [Gilbertella persicaria]